MALTEAQRALADTMSEISEFCWFASWLTGTEYRLWQFMVDPTDNERWGNHPIPPEYRERLQQMAEAAGGWVYWRDGEDVPVDEWGEAFVTMAHWLPMYETWRRGQLEARKLPRRYGELLTDHLDEGGPTGGN
jgi:hypothetical protein